MTSKQLKNLEELEELSQITRVSSFACQTLTYMCGNLLMWQSIRMKHELGIERC